MTESKEAKQVATLKQEPISKISPFNFPAASFNASATFRYEEHSYSIYRKFPLLEQLKKGNAIWGPNGQLPRQDINFIGRKDLLGNLRLALEKEERPVHEKPSIIIVYAGLGGVGKTELILNYIRNTKYPYSLRAWFQAEKQTDLENSYMGLARALGYEHDKPSLSDAVAHVNQELVKYPNWLFIYDNATHVKDIESFLPDGKGSILITTRQQNWPKTYLTLPVNEMSIDDAIDLIKSFIPESTETEEIKLLADDLGRLPLALAQAGAYIKKHERFGCSISNYRERYKKGAAELLEKDLPEGSHSLPVAVTWNITLETIIAESKRKNEIPLALHLLVVCAYLSPESIPQLLLKNWFDVICKDLKVQAEFSETISQLYSYSMINVDKAGHISIHRLVQEIIRNQHLQRKPEHICSAYPSPALEWCHLLLETAHQEFNKDDSSQEAEVHHSLLFPHLQALLEHYDRLCSKNIHISLVNILNDIGWWFYRGLGMARLTMPYYERALNMQETLCGKDKEHPGIATILNNLATVFLALGDAKRAIKDQVRALVIWEKIYGKDKEHPRIATCLNNLGESFRTLGDAERAIEYHQRALDMWKGVYGKDKAHPNIATNLNNLGLDFFDLGDAEQAIKYNQCALTMWEKIYGKGKEHRGVAQSLNNLGLAFDALGKAEQAIEYHQRALDMRKAIYGKDKDHPDIATSLNNLGSAFDTLGKFNSAIENYQRALAMREKIYYKDQAHPDIARVLNNLGSTSYNLGKAKKAIEYHQRALDMRKAIYGKDKAHPDVAQSLNNLGTAFQDLGKLKQAIEYHQRALEMLETIYGKDKAHLTVAMNLINLGEAFRASGDLKQAIECHQRALEMLETICDKESLEAMRTRKFLYSVKNVGNVTTSADSLGAKSSVSSASLTPLLQSQGSSAALRVSRKVIKISSPKFI